MKMISPMLYTKGAQQQRGGQEIAPQTISTKDVYQSKHMVVLLLSRGVVMLSKVEGPKSPKLFWALFI